MAILAAWTVVSSIVQYCESPVYLCIGRSLEINIASTCILPYVASVITGNPVKLVSHLALVIMGTISRGGCDARWPAS